MMLRVSQSEEEAIAIWKGRKSAIGAFGRVSDYYCMDGVIPLGKLAQVLKQVQEVGNKYKLKVANIFHAGDGNLHSLILYNANDEREKAAAEKCGADILKLCVDAGGCLTGETWRWNREAGADALSIFGSGPAPADAREVSLRSAMAFELRQGVSARPSNAFHGGGRDKSWLTSICQATRRSFQASSEAAKAGNYPLEVCGFRSKREAGRPVNPAAVVSTAKLSGITFYEPGELVISAKAGTPLHEVEAALARKNQELPFEPADFSRLYGPDPMAASLGSVAALNISGPRRILRGAARDYLLGVRAVNGEGVAIKSGGRVMKNVTGVDLVKGLCGSWGTLAVLTELTFKVLPKAREARTLVFFGLSDEAGVGVMSEAMGTPYEVSGTIHLHGSLAGRLNDAEIASANTALTALRVEGAPESVGYRMEKLRRQLSPFGRYLRTRSPEIAQFLGRYSLARLSVRELWAPLMADYGRAVEGCADRARSLRLFRLQRGL